MVNYLVFSTQMGHIRSYDITTGYENAKHLLQEWHGIEDVLADPGVTYSRTTDCLVYQKVGQQSPTTLYIMPLPSLTPDFTVLVVNNEVDGQCYRHSTPFTAKKDEWVNNKLEDPDIITHHEYDNIGWYEQFGSFFFTIDVANLRQIDHYYPEEEEQ